jgi:PAS domain S-box-containing protein
VTRENVAEENMPPTARTTERDEESYLKPQRRGKKDRNLAVVTLDAEGKIVHTNQAFTEMCGYSLRELRGRKTGEVLRGPKTEKTVARELDRAVIHGEPFECSITNYRKDHSPYRVHIRLEPVFDPAESKIIQFQRFEEQIA